MTQRRNIDRRSRVYRRYEELVRTISSDIGVDQLSTAQDALVRQAATLVLRAENLREQILNGEVIDDDALVRLSNAATRTLSALIAQRRKTEKRPKPLKDYLAESLQT